MSNRELCVSMLDGFSEAQLGNVAAMLQTMKQTIEDALCSSVPNAETIAALKETDEMIRTGAGQHFKGSTADFFAMLDEEDEEGA